MRISKILVPFVTLGISTAIGGYYFFENQKTLEGQIIRSNSLGEGDLDSVQKESNQIISNSSGKQSKLITKDDAQQQNIIKTAKANREVYKENETKNFTGKLLFSSKYKNEDGTSHFFYSGSLLTNREYQEQEKDYITQKEKAKQGGWNYTGKIDFDISNPIDKEKAQDYLNEQNNKLNPLASQLTTQAIVPLQQNTKDNETKFKEIFGDDVYKSVMDWTWK